MMRLLDSFFAFVREAKRLLKADTAPEEAVFCEGRFRKTAKDKDHVRSQNILSRAFQLYLQLPQLQ